MNSFLDHGRIHRLRTARGLTQAELADSIDVPASAFSRMLTGSLAVDGEATNRLAVELDCTPELLRRGTSDVLFTRPWLRAYADAPKKTVDQNVADAVLALEAFESLRLKRIPDHLPLFAEDPNNDEDIDEFAAQVRDVAEVDSPVAVPNVTRAAERLGCVVLPMDHELGKHLGMSMHVDGVPVLRASRPSSDGGIPGDRQRFTVAHELGHLTMHSTCPPPETTEQARTIEKQAHRFAGAFLLPGDAFLDDLEARGQGRVTLATLAQMKEHWGVAIKAMVVRLQNLHRIDADQARSLYKQISARSWNKAEPVQVLNERAIWLEKALAKRFPDGDAVASAAIASELGRSYFESWLRWEAVEQRDASIIAFPAEAADERGRTRPRKPGTVTRL
ncbi:XRE family transcriptional regulator [Nocardioides sp.]|uniref:helix-turn-helix domain-containing protein n=1 Tax=Nocardioides sp. TaxID=35761 RepID=UPI00321A748D